MSPLTFSTEFARRLSLNPGGGDSARPQWSPEFHNCEIAWQCCRDQSRTDAFPPANDPYAEYDFGNFDYAAKTVIWKIACYDRDLNFGFPDPSDRA